jgi:hypothetical protein
LKNKITENTPTSIDAFPGDLKIAKESVYDLCGLQLTNLHVQHEGTVYGACSFNLNGKLIQHRVSKITPTKTGQFVTVWKRNKQGITAPFDYNDDIDFIIITSRSGDQLGQFIFPKSILLQEGILTQPTKEGKRGMRVYPPWDLPTNKQAKKTQDWQTNYFLAITTVSATELDRMSAFFKG